MLSSLSLLGEVIGWAPRRSPVYFLTFFFFFNKGIQCLNSCDVREVTVGRFREAELSKGKVSGMEAQPPLGPASFRAFARGLRFPPPTVVQNGVCYTGSGGTVESSSWT